MVVIFLVSISSAIGFVTYNNLPWSDLLSLSLYQNLANPRVRVVQIQEGLRKEEVANVVAEKLGWNDVEKNDFLNAHIALGKTNLEGYYFPKSYLIDKNSSPVDVTQIMVTEFNKETKNIKKPKTTKIINQDTAVKVASIIQREAAGKGDMKLISGIIWNRIFKGMKLQMDATIQYVKGSQTNWWPQLTPDDMSIKSPYNTYLHADLPPTPISNPGLAAIEASYNPQTTNCLFYLHDRNGVIHCSVTYAQHLKNISKYY